MYLYYIYIHLYLSISIYIYIQTCEGLHGTNLEYITVIWGIYIYVYMYGSVGVIWGFCGGYLGPSLSFGCCM